MVRDERGVRSIRQIHPQIAPYHILLRLALGVKRAGCRVILSPPGGHLVHHRLQVRRIGNLQFREMSDWHTDLSIRTGLQLDSGTVVGRSLQLLLEYYNGRSVDGQFFKLPVEYVGAGLHFNF